MSGDKQALVLFLQTEPDYDQADAAELARSLRRTLLDTNIEDARLAEGDELPAEAKAARAINWNTNILSLIWAGTLITSIKITLNTWLRHRPDVRLILQVSPAAADAVVRQLKQLRNHQISIRDPHEPTPSELNRLQQQMIDQLNFIDIGVICMDLGTSLDHIGSLKNNLTGKIVALIDHCRKRFFIDE